MLKSENQLENENQEIIISCKKSLTLKGGSILLNKNNKYYEQICKRRGNN